jgi:hypothetical protein
VTSPPSEPIAKAAWDAFQREDAQPPVTEEDLRPRTTAPPTAPKTPTFKPAVADPEAPYGWIDDPTAPGGRRPKKRPGKQSTKGTLPPPAKRPATEPRTRSAPAGSSRPKDYSQPLAEAAQAVWFLLAGVPTPDEPTKVLGVDLVSASIRLKAQAAVLEDNTGQIVASVNLMAQHSKPVRTAVEKYTAETGPAWILPAMMALLPFAVQSAMIWRAPVPGDLSDLAKRTDAKFDEVVKAMTNFPAPEESPDGPSAE